MMKPVHLAQDFPAQRALTPGIPARQNRSNKALLGRGRNLTQTRLATVSSFGPPGAIL